MPRSRLTTLVLTPLIAIGALFATWTWYSRWQSILKGRREATYAQALAAWSRDAPLGMDRARLETLFLSRGLQFRHIGHIDGDQADCDLVSIGSDPRPWYCSSESVFLAFRFSGVRTSLLPAPKDTLKRIEIFRMGEGCL